MLINTRLAERLKKINPSQTLAITTKAKKLKSEGQDIISFAAGEPDFDTPDIVKEAAIEAIKQGFTRYTATSGILELKELICDKFKRDNLIEYLPNQIVVSSGAKHSIFNVLFVLVNRNDEVLIPSPYWVSYPEMVHLCEGVPRFIKTLPENNFKANIVDIEKHITSKTKLIILNSPSNPSGCVYSIEELKEIAEICVKKKIFVISDEIYEKIIYDNLKHISIASLGEEIKEWAITVNGVSKSYAMTGWRIGYLGGPLDIVEAISKLQDHTTSNPVSISQKAAVAALNIPDTVIRNTLKDFQIRRDYVIDRLNRMKKISYIKPQGAFYIFCNISKTGMDSLSFANRLMDEAKVAVIPGGGFGKNDFIRISFATSSQLLEKGMNRIEEWLMTIKDE